MKAHRKINVRVTGHHMSFFVRGLLFFGGSTITTLVPDERRRSSTLENVLQRLRTLHVILDYML